MDQATQLEPARIEALLGAYRELQAQFALVRERLRRAEDHRHTVARRVYDRVRADYDRELDSIRARLTPLRDELDRMHESLEAQCREAASALQAVEEELSEAEFRNRIGEYPSPMFEEMRRALDTRASDARSRQDSFQASLAAIAAMRSPDADDVAHAGAPMTTDAALSEAPVASDTGATPPRSASGPASTTLSALSTDEFVDDIAAIVVDEPPTLEPVQEPAHAPAAAVLEEITGSQQVPGADDLRPSSHIVAFENPQQWISEMGADTSRAERRVRLSAPVPPAAKSPARDEIDSVLAPLAEGAAAAPSSSAVAELPPETPSLPSLVFVSGPHTGQSIALLPTTLTIGREHDNNVEIKDPDVARYHARILRERDDFVVEDLNSSTGTFVNGERQQRAVLSHGDVIRVGKTELALDFEWTSGSH